MESLGLSASTRTAGLLNYPHEATYLSDSYQPRPRPPLRLSRVASHLVRQTGIVLARASRITRQP